MLCIAHSGFSLAAILGLVACNPLAPYGLRCSESSDCPEGQFCNADGTCGDRALDTIDASVPDDADPPPPPEEKVDVLIEDLRVTDTMGDSLIPQIAWDGHGYGVAWSEDRGGNQEIYFAHISVSGVIENEVRVTNAPGYSTDPCLLWTGSDFAIAWADDRDDQSEIYFIRLSTEGDVVTPERRITNDPAGSLDPRLSWTGSEFGLAWMDYRGDDIEVYFARLDPTGSVVGSEIQITDAPGSAESPQILWAEGRYFLAWQDGRHGADEIYVQTLNAAGGTLVAATRLTDADDLSGDAQIAWTGTALAVIWEDYRTDIENIYLALVDNQLNRSTPDLLLSDPAIDSGRPSVVWTGKDLAVLWQDDHSADSGTDLIVGRVNSAAQSLGYDVPITNTPGRSINSGITWNGKEYAAVWSDDRDGDTLEIYLREFESGECETPDDCSGSEICLAFACVAD